MTDEPCPLCGLDAVGRPGPVYSGTARVWLAKTTFTERLFRCADGHLYSVRREERRGATSVRSEAHESIASWIELRTGGEPPRRPPGV